MGIQDGFKIKIYKSTRDSRKGVEQMIIVINRAYAYLLPDLQKVFQHSTDVEVKLDSRHGEQRAKKETLLDERRQSDRRIKRESLVDVVISTRI